MNKVTVLFFASLRDLTGVRNIELEIEEDLLVLEFRRMLGVQFPNLSAGLNSALIAVNKEYAFDEDEIPHGAEVAIFPPVSGGSNNARPTYLEITDAELDLDKLLNKITTDRTGAACMFTGMVRGLTSRSYPRETIYLEYEAYKPMAEKKIAQIAEEIRQRWPDVEGIGIVQRIGRLYPHTPTVIIACTAAHRDTGVFDAARYGIDRLKEIVPIWKKEVGSEGEQWIEGEYLPTRDD